MKKRLIPVLVGAFLLGACDINVSFGDNDKDKQEAQDNKQQQADYNQSSNQQSSNDQDSDSDGQSDSASSESEKYVNINDDGFHDDYFYNNYVDGYGPVYIGMTLSELENKLGNRTNTKDLLTGRHDIYGNYAVVLSDNKVISYAIVPDSPVPSSQLKQVFGTPTYESSSEYIFDSNKNNGFAIYVERDENGNGVALGQYDDVGLESLDKNTSSDEFVTRANVIDFVESFEGDYLDTDKYTYREPEKRDDGWGFAFYDKSGNLAGSYIVEDDGHVKKYDSDGDQMYAGY